MIIVSVDACFWQALLRQQEKALEQGYSKDYQELTRRYFEQLQK